MTAPGSAPTAPRAVFFTNPAGVPFVEHEHNGIDPNGLAEELAHAGFTDVRVVPAIEDTQHAHGSPLVVLACAVCKGGDQTPVLVCPTCAQITARVAAAKPTLVATAKGNRAALRPSNRPASPPRTKPKKRKRRK